MKKTVKSLIATALAVCCITPLVACGSAETLTSKPNAGISAGVASSVKSYDSIAYYEKEKSADVKIAFKTKEIQKVSFKYRVLEDDEYSFDDNVLTVDKSVFKDESAGDKRLRVFVDNKYVEITVRVVTKVIYTVADFNSIRNNLNGTYVLGADIDFGGQEFWPIGKPIGPTGTSFDDDGNAVYEYDAQPFEGIFDGMGHSVQNLIIRSHNRTLGEDDNNQGPSLGSAYSGSNDSAGIFMATGGSAQIINTSFVNITISGRWLFGTVVGANGGLIKNCYVTTTINQHGDYANRAGGIVGINGSGDAAGRIENCLCIYEQQFHTDADTSTAAVRGIADFNNGIIKNCYAATKDSFVFHLGYDHELKGVPEDFDYDEFITEDNWLETGVSWNNTIPAFPGALAWDAEKGAHVYYKGGDIINSDIVRKEFFLDPDNFSEEDGWDRSVWTFTYGGYPTLKIQDR